MAESYRRGIDFMREVYDLGPALAVACVSQDGQKDFQFARVQKLGVGVCTLQDKFGRMVPNVDRPILWQKWLDQMSDSGSQVSTTTILKPHSFPAALEPILAYPEHPLAPWAPWSQFLPVLDVSKLGHTASTTLSSPRSETLPTLASDWPECSSFTQFRCPLTPDPAEITFAHFDSCIDPLILLAHQAMQLSTFSRAEIWHRFCGNYFLPESTHFTPFLQPYVPSPGMHPVWKHKHSNVSVEKTAILESQSRARDLLYFLGRHWLRHSVRFYNHRTMATSSLATSVAAASPVPLPREPQPNGQDMMLDPALPNLLLDPENLAKFEPPFPAMTSRRWYSQPRSSGISKPPFGLSLCRPFKMKLSRNFAKPRKKIYLKSLQP